MPNVEQPPKAVANGPRVGFVLLQCSNSKQAFSLGVPNCTSKRAVAGHHLTLTPKLWSGTRLNIAAVRNRCLSAAWPLLAGRRSHSSRQTVFAGSTLFGFSKFNGCQTVDSAVPSVGQIQRAPGTTDSILHRPTARRERAVSTEADVPQISVRFTGVFSEEQRVLLYHAK